LGLKEGLALAANSCVSKFWILGSLVLLWSQAVYSEDSPELFIESYLENLLTAEDPLVSSAPPQQIELECGSKRDRIVDGSGATVEYKFSEGFEGVRDLTNCCNMGLSDCTSTLLNHIDMQTPAASCPGCGSCGQCGSQLEGCEPRKMIDMPNEKVGWECTAYGLPPIKSCRIECWLKRPITVTLECTKCTHPPPPPASTGSIHVLSEP
jgi:hypothetical protein